MELENALIELAPIQCGKKSNYAIFPSLLYKVC
jgi:hypothetical protein